MDLYVGNIFTVYNYTLNINTHVCSIHLQTQIFMVQDIVKLHTRLLHFCKCYIRRDSVAKDSRTIKE